MNEPAHQASPRSGRLLLVNPTIVDKPEHLHIGLGTVGTFVQQHSRHSVRILDFVAYRRKWRERLAEELRTFKPDLVGLYISTPYFRAATEVAREIKRLAPDLPIVAGGHHATLAPEKVINEPVFDCLIVGEGERPTIDLMNAVVSGSPLDDVPGLWWREDGEIRKTPMAPLLEAELMPPVDWSLHDEETLRQAFYLWGVLPVMASRGCPSKCSFCAITNVQKLYAGQKFLRFRDPIEVVDEIERNFVRYREYGMRLVFFYDLNFLIRPDWFEAFAQEYRRRGLNARLPWSAYTRGDHLNPRVLAALEGSGCVNLRIGIESANQTMRNDIYKKELPQDVLERSLQSVKKLGISVTGYFIAGGPGERPEWLLESLDFAHREGVEFPVFFLYKPLAGTDVLDDAAAMGSFLRDDADTAHGDFLHGVHMDHEHIDGWQIQAFVYLSHLVFGIPLVRERISQNGVRFVPRMLRYVSRAMRLGFPAYEAITYFLYYGYDHLAAPPVFPRRPEANLTWRAVMAANRLWLRSPRRRSEKSGKASGAQSSARARLS